jgi:hypothetical protein
MSRGAAVFGPPRIHSHSPARCRACIDGGGHRFPISGGSGAATAENVPEGVRGAGALHPRQGPGGCPGRGRALPFGRCRVARRPRPGSAGEQLEVATAYVSYRKGLPWAAMHRVIEQCVESDSEHPKQRVFGVATSAYWVDAELEPDDPAQFTHAKRSYEAAAMLAAYGSRRCMRVVFDRRAGQPRICRALLAGERGRRERYCSEHPAGIDEAGERGDREAITGLLRGVGVALRVG